LSVTGGWGKGGADMTRSLALSLPAAAFLLLSAPAEACEKHAKVEPQQLAATCTCTGKGDCTCKKGQCKCKKCEGHHFVEPLKGRKASPELPSEARSDASAGIFI